MIFVGEWASEWRDDILSKAPDKIDGTLWMSDYAGGDLTGARCKQVSCFRFLVSDVKRGSKNRNSLQFRVLEIEFLNSKLDFTFW